MEEMLEIFGMEFADPFFVYALPWLLVFAIVYGLLSQIGEGVPKSKSSRAVISTVLAFFSLLFAETIMAFLKQMGSGAIIVLTAFIFYMILEELGEEEGTKELVEGHSKGFAIVVIIIITVLFLGAGGAELIGITQMLPAFDPATMVFLAIVAFAIYWMINATEMENEEK